jgi:toxin ParE1/3/4
VSKWKLTNKAQSELADITLYTTDTWGDAQAERYLALLLHGFDLIAEKPGIGRACDRLAPDLRRFELGKHVVFYRRKQAGILISRILHQSSLPTRRLFMDD